MERNVDDSLCHASDAMQSFSLSLTQLARTRSARPRPVDVVHLDNWCRIDGRNRMVVDTSGKLVAADAGSWAIIEQETVLKFCDGRVQPVNRSHMARFQALLTVRSNMIRTLALSAPRAPCNLLLHAADIGEEGVQKIGLCCINLDSDELPEWADLTAFFDLTSAECQVIKELLNGFSPSQIAARQHLSITTVRTHVYHAYNKLDVSHREELWPRLAPYRIR